MARTASRMTRAERLVDDLLDGAAADPVRAELLSWMTSSPAFRTFVESHHDKIRKKLRGAATPDARLGVRAELRVAALLLAERHLTLAYEGYGSSHGGPDFTLTFRGERPVNVEVTRLGRDPSTDHLAGVLLAKLRQLPPSAPNLLVILAAGGPVTEATIAAAVRTVLDRADRKEEELFIRAGYEGSRGFYTRYLRLGAIAVLGDPAGSQALAGTPSATWWTSGSARIPVPAATARVCRNRLGAAG